MKNSQDKVPQSLWQLADSIIESQKKLASMSEQDKKLIDWNLLHELWVDEIEEAWNKRSE